MIKKNFFCRCFVQVGLILILFQIQFAQVKEESKNLDSHNLPAILEIKGEHIKAILVSLNAFNAESEILQEKKKIENYEIYIRENKDNMFVKFSPNVAKNEKLSYGGETSLGVEVEYIISKKDYKL